jgi:transposase
MEGCTGWRYVVEEMAAAGITPHLAEPTDTAALRSRKRHAKTDTTRPTPGICGPTCWPGPARVRDPAAARAGGPGRRAAV